MQVLFDALLLKGVLIGVKRVSNKCGFVSFVFPTCMLPK